MGAHIGSAGITTSKSKPPLYASPACMGQTHGNGQEMCGQANVWGLSWCGPAFFFSSATGSVFSRIFNSLRNTALINISFHALSMAISENASDPTRDLAPALPHDVLLRLLSNPCLLPRHLAQARLVCQSWARAADESITIVRLGSLPPPLPPKSGRSKGGTRHAEQRTASRLFARLAHLPSLGSLWLGPAVVRAIAVPQSHHVLSLLSSAPSGHQHPLHALASSPSLISLRLQPEAQEAFALPQVGSCY